MSRRRLAIGVAVLVGAAAVLLGVNEAGNASARAELEPACVCADAVARRVRSNMGYLHAVYGDDANAVYRAMEREVAEPCERLPQELSVGTFNLGRSWAPARTPEQAQRLRAIVERNRERCVDSHVERGSSRSEAEALCASLFTELTRDPSSLSMPVWDWPSELQRTLCLELR